MKKLRLLFLIVLTFSVLDSFAQTWIPVESSHFGVDGFESADFFRLTPQQLDDAYNWEASGLRNMNMAWNRTLSPTGGQFRWNVIEAVQGTYDWSKPDAFVNRIQAEGLRLLVLVHPFAQWDQPGKNDMNYDKPNNMTAFKRFIAKLVERYDADGVNDMPGLLYPIRYYEIGNEPELQTFGDAPGTYNDFMETVKAARDTAKIVYPDVKIVIGGASPIYDSRGFLNQVDSFWKGALNRSNAGSYFDIFNFHFFVGEYSQDISVYIDYWKQLLSAYGLSGKEIWLTETGTYSGTASNLDGTTWPNQSTTYQAGWWIKQASYALANGVSKLFWVFYYSDQTDWRSKVAFVNIDKTTKKAVYYAHKFMADKIDAYSSALQNAYAESGQYQTSGNFKFTVAGKPVYVLWDDANGNVTLSGFSTSNVKIKKGVPQLNIDGSVVLDNSSNPTFDTSMVSVTNGQVTIALSSIPIYVEEVAVDVNRAPAFTTAGQVATVSTKYGTPYSFNYAATDADGQTLTYSLLSFTPASTATGTAAPTVTTQFGLGNFTWTPTFADKATGTFTATIQVTDGITPVTTTTVFTIVNAYNHGDVTLSGGNADAVDALAILKHIVNSPALSAEGLSYADVNSDGNVNAYDAYWILYYVANNNTWPLSKVVAASGQVEFGNLVPSNNNTVTIPVTVMNTKGVNSVSFEGTLNGNGVDVKSLKMSLPSDWIVVSSTENGKVQFAAAGLTALTEGTIANIELTIKNKETVATISGNVRLNSALSSDISAKVREIPTEFSLSQNYPNPFNPSTNISYKLQGTSYTTLKVYDALGREVATLVNEEQQPGTYVKTFFGKSLPSGVYCYVLRAGNYTSSKKMLLLK